MTMSPPAKEAVLDGEARLLFDIWGHCTARRRGRTGGSSALLLLYCWSSGLLNILACTRTAVGRSHDDILHGQRRRPPCDRRRACRHNHRDG